MLRLTISTPDTRKSVIISEDKTPRETLEDENINIGAASLILDGAMLSPESQRKNFRELGVTGDATLAVCVKLANA